MDYRYIEMGNRIQNRCKELRLKQSDLAELLDISNNHLSAIENGKQKPSMDTFMAICEKLAVTPDYLLLGIIHASNIPQNIVEKLRLCNQEDLDLIEKITEFMVERNMAPWNKKNFI